MTIKGCLEIRIQIKSKGYLFIFKCTITIQSMTALLFFERVFDSTRLRRVQKFHRRVKCPTWIQHGYSTSNEVSILPIFKFPFNSYTKKTVHNFLVICLLQEIVYFPHVYLMKL